MKTDTAIPVLAMSNWSPEQNRLHLDLPHGYTIDEIVRHALPAASSDVLDHTRVMLVTEKGSEVILPEVWRTVRPRPGVRVVIRVLPGKNALRSILSVVVSIAAFALAGAWGAAVGGWLGLSGATAATVGGALVATGVTVLGNLLINALIPPVEADTESRNTYSISGFKNQAVPNGAVPVVLGSFRFAPPFAALPHTEIVGDDQYIRALFVAGEGQTQIDDIRIGETSVAEFDEVEIEVRDGVDGDLPIALFPRQVVEEQIGVELTRPLPRDDLGEVIDGEAELTPVVRTTGQDASGASVILNFPAGLVRYNDDGDKRTRSVTILIEQRRVDAEEWQEVEEIKVSAKKAEAFWRQYTWEFPSRGQYQIRCTMLTKESNNSRIIQRTSWAALQTLRPEYPLAYPRPLSLIGMRIKATHQINGALDNVTVLASRICKDWDAESGTWVTRATQNPASLYRYVLQSPENPKRATDAEIDLDKLQEWHEFCETHGLTYNRVLSGSDTLLGDVLSEIAAAGRATKEHDGVRWSVVVDNPTSEARIVDHISPRNSWGLRSSRSYFEPPHAITCTFSDAENDYKQAQREVRWPGYEGDIEITEAWSLPGKVYADEVWREIRRRQLEAIYRPDTYEVTQDGALRVVTRGDHVMTSSYSLSRTQVDARVLRVSGNAIEIDELISMTEGETYAIRFRHFTDTEDTIGQSVTRLLSYDEEETSLLHVLGSGPMPLERDVVQIGPATATSFHQIVSGIERTSDQCSITHLIDAAPEIDVELEATDIPAWSSRVGEELDPSVIQPGTPRFTAVSSELYRDGESTFSTWAYRVSYLLSPGSGIASTAYYQVQHRLAGAAEWTEITIPAANGGDEIEGYTLGNVVEIRARAISLANVKSAYTPTITITVGAADADIPAALDEEAISITTLLGGALIQMATGSDEATAAIQVYRSTSAVLDRETDAVGDPLSISPQSSYSTTLGDTTRENLITGGTMNDAGAWALGAGWVIAGGVASHTAGTIDGISQSFAAVTGKFYRIGYVINGLTAGNVMPRLTGGSDRIGTAALADGIYSDRIQAVTGNNTIEFLASSDFGGTLDDVVAYLETDACLAQGTHYVWLEPQNADGVPGPIAGPFEITII